MVAYLVSVLTKILFTLGVIIAVVLIFRKKQRRNHQSPHDHTHEVGSVPTRTLAYGILAVLIAISIATAALVGMKSG